MNFRRKWSAAALAACAPVVAMLSAKATGATLFSENFDAAAAAGRFTIQQVDNDPAVENIPADYDTAVNYAFNYGSFNYVRSDPAFNPPDPAENVITPIPPAPNSTGGTTIGLRLDVNNVDTDPMSALVPETAIINLFPKAAEFAGGVVPNGDHTFKFDLWMNYTGRALGGGGSTEYMVAGVNQSGAGLGGPVLDGDPGNPGQSIAIDGERGGGSDYRLYRANTRFLTTPTLDPDAGYVAQDEGSGFRADDGDNSFYQGLFPYPAYETAGAIGKKWIQAELRYEDGIVYCFLNNTLIAARTDLSASSGTVMVGYADFNNSVAAPEAATGNNDANFAIFDNLRVETIASFRQKWSHNGGGNWSEIAKWLASDDAGGVAEVADFTTALSAPQTINVDTARTVRAVHFSSANGYALAGVNAITLNTQTTGIYAHVKASAGSHVISAPLVAARPVRFDVAAGAKVTVSNFNAGGFKLFKEGAGVAEVNVLRAPSVSITGGTLRVTPSGAASAVSVIPAISIIGTGKLDLADNKLVTEEPVGTWNGSSYSGVAGLVDAGRGGVGNALWDGLGIITTDTRAISNGDLVSIAVAQVNEVRNVAATATTAFAGQTVLGADTLVMVTWGGDANLDGKINIDDYGRIDGNVGQSGNVFGWSRGDFNYDGKINIDDYGIIDGNINRQGTPFVTSGAALMDEVSAVPEPASALVVTGILGAMTCARKRRRCL
jgi:hypothetical protein